MKVKCPACGVEFMVSTGRPKLKITSDLIIQMLCQNRSVAKAAKTLGCSQKYICNVLRTRGIDPKNITGRKYQRREK